MTSSENHVPRAAPQADVPRADVPPDFTPADLVLPKVDAEPDVAPSGESAAPAAAKSFGRLLLGAATLAGERLHLVGKDQAPAAAIVVGLASDGRDAVTKRFVVVVRSARSAVPVDKVRQAVDHARSRGQETITTSRDEADVWIHETLHTPMTWTTTKAIPHVLDDMTPYMTDEFMPKIIDAMMPEIREKVLPAIIDDLTTDPRVRVMIAEQSSGAVAAAADELRKATSTADDQIEHAFRRTFGRRQPT